MSEKSVNLFVYGTLMEREQIEVLLKRKLGEPAGAVTEGATLVVSDWGYPAMIPSETHTVRGVVWRGLTDQDLTILDRYERCDMKPPLYRREQRKILIENQEEDAWMYLGTPTFLTQMNMKRDE